MKETRRAALKRMALFLGGLGSVAAGAGGWKLARDREGETLTFQGRGWHIYSRSLAKGQLPEGGDRMLAYGDLYAAEKDVKVGEFAATYFGLHQPVAGGRLASLEQHAFTLAGGAIFGSGMTRAGFATEDEFAIVGGTGRYAGARGTYVVRQSHLEFGGDGTAVITFRLISGVTS